MTTYFFFVMNGKHEAASPKARKHSFNMVANSMESKSSPDPGVCLSCHNQILRYVFRLSAGRLLTCASGIQYPKYYYYTVGRSSMQAQVLVFNNSTVLPVSEIHRHPRVSTVLAYAYFVKGKFPSIILLKLKPNQHEPSHTIL